MLNRTNVALGILVLVSLVTLGLVTYETIHGDPTPAVIQTLLGVVLGFLGNNLASAQGAEQALSTPPGATSAVSPGSSQPTSSMSSAQSAAESQTPAPTPSPPV